MTMLDSSFNTLLLVFGNKRLLLWRHRIDFKPPIHADVEFIFLRSNTMPPSPRDNNAISRGYYPLQTLPNILLPNINIRSIPHYPLSELKFISFNFRRKHSKPFPPTNL